MNPRTYTRSQKAKTAVDWYGIAQEAIRVRFSDGKIEGTTTAEGADRLYKYFSTERNLAEGNISIRSAEELGRFTFTLQVR